MLKKIILVFLLLLLFGCGSDSDKDSNLFTCDSGEEDIVGCWLSDCSQLTDRDENPIDVWTTHKISFRENGDIKILTNTYDNDSCDGIPLDSLSAYEHSSSSLNYIVGGDTVDSNGVPAREIQVLMTIPDHATSFDALYHITSDQKLCTSELIIIEPKIPFGFSDFLSQDIDMTNCLTRAE